MNLTSGIKLRLSSPSSGFYSMKINSFLIAPRLEEMWSWTCVRPSGCGADADGKAPLIGIRKNRRLWLKVLKRLCIIPAPVKYL